MSEPTSKSVDLLSAISASQMSASDLAYIADVSESDPDDFNRSATLSAIANWIANNLGAVDAQLRESIGADVASANNLTLGNDGNTFTITGTTTINTIASKGIGTVVRLRFSAALQLTHSADLSLPGAANLTTAAGDVATFQEYAASDWRLIAYQRGAGLWMLNPMTTLGDLIVGGASGAPGRLAAGTEGQFLAVGESGLEWVTVSPGSGLGNVVEDTTPQLGGVLDANGHQIRESKGADVASASELAIGDDGNTFDVTGTTTIATIAAKGVGTRVALQFDGELTLTHSADLVLPTGADITTAAGDTAIFEEYAAGDWRCIVYQRASGEALVTPATGLSNVVEDTTPQLGGVLDANGHQIRESKGADVASASELTLGADGNYFVVTGTTAITSIGTVGVGTRVALRFAAALTLTHHATDLILPSGASITTAAGDVAVFREYAAGDWVCESYQRASGAALVAPAAFDPASPGAIGGTTPAAGTFTAITVNGGGNALTVVGNINSDINSIYPYFAISYPTGRFSIHATSKLQWANTGDYLNTPDFFFGRGGVQTGQFGEDATSPAAQTLKAPNATGSNNQGGKMTIAGGAGHGSGAQGDVYLEGDVTFLDGDKYNVSVTPLKLPSYSYDTTPPPSPADQIIIISNASSDTANPQDAGRVIAISDGDYFRYQSDGSIVGGSV